jgi:hypothetical protein
MNLRELVEHLGAVTLTPGVSLDVPVDRVYAGDRMSDLINAAGPGMLLVTNLDGAQLLRVAELMDVAGVCLARGAAPKPETVAAAAAQGVVLLASPGDLFETCGLLYERIGATAPGNAVDEAY